MEMMALDIEGVYPEKIYSETSLKGHAETKAKTGVAFSLYGIDNFRIENPKPCPHSDVRMLVGLAS
jgi:hypothetical protein